MSKPDDEVYKHFFPVRDTGLIVGVRARRDGAPICWNNHMPILAQYVLLDEFETPVLDPSLCWFETGDEALFVADVYLALVAESHPCADRFFSDAWHDYIRYRKKLPQFVISLKRATAERDPQTSSIAIREFLRLGVD